MNNLRTTSALAVKKLVRDAFEDAKALYPGEVPPLDFQELTPQLSVTGQPAALKHALAEVLLNALQASKDDPQVKVHVERQQEADGTARVEIRIVDSGPGFSPEARVKALKPFYTERKVGMGLGLTVADKIVKQHGGTLQIEPFGKDQPGLVVISLPAS